MALASLAATVDDAFAVTTIKGSKPIGSERIDPRDPQALKACVDNGGKVFKSDDGEAICNMTVDVLKTAYFWQAAQICSELGGNISEDREGNTICRFEPQGRPPH
jgi:hypothetical protein